MLALIWIFALLLMLGIYTRIPNLIVLYFLSWGLLVVNYYIGPLTYPEATIYISSVIAFLAPILFFALGYLTMHIAANNRIYISTDLRISTETTINKIGAIFCLSWVLGGLIYALPFILSFDLHALRTSFIEGEKSVSFFSQIGNIFSGLSWFVVARVAINRGTYSPWSARLTLFSLLLIPIFMAGRQIYFQLILMLLIGLIVSSKYKIKSPPLLVDASSLMRQAAVIAIVLISVITVIRFAGEILVYDTKLDQFSRISGADLNSNYNGFYELLPTWTADILIEFDYYFSAQLVNFLERFSAIDASIIDFRMLEKSPFLKNNINKLCSILGLSCFESRSQPFIGSISDSAWGTVFSTNFQLFGVIGTFVVTWIFGAICSLSQSAFKSSPRNFIAWNFFLANSVVAFYSIMDSVFNEMYFLVYYVTSLVLFASSARLSTRNRRKHILQKSEYAQN